MFTAHIEVDTALMSKVERGERKLNRKQVVKLAKFFSASQEELISVLLCCKIMDAVGDDSLPTKGIKIVITKSMR